MSVGGKNLNSFTRTLIPDLFAESITASSFTLKWTAAKDSAKLQDMKGEMIDVFKSHTEGEFE